MTQESASSGERPFLPDLTVPKVIFGTLVVLSVGAGFWLLVRFAPTFFTLFAAMILGTALRPGLEWLKRRGFSRRFSAVLVYLALVALVAGFLVLLMPLVASQTAAIAARLPAYIETARLQMAASSSSILNRMADELPSPSQTALSTGPLVALTSAQAFAGSKLLGNGLFTLLTVLLLGYYWSLEGEVAVRAIVLFLKPAHREGVREVVEAAETMVGLYVRGQLVVCLVTAAMSIVAFSIMGLPGALVLALIAGALGAVPIFGAPVGFTPALLMAASVDTRLVPWVFLTGVVVHLFQDYVIAPRVMRQAVGVHPFVVLLAISGFGSFLGVAGAVLAIPMAAIIQLLVDRLVFDADRNRQPETPQRDRVGVLRLEAKSLALDVRRQGRRKDAAEGTAEDSMEDMVESIANELDAMLGDQVTRARS